MSNIGQEISNILPTCEISPNIFLFFLSNTDNGFTQVASSPEEIIKYFFSFMTQHWDMMGYTLK